MENQERIPSRFDDCEVQLGGGNFGDSIILGAILIPPDSMNWFVDCTFEDAPPDEDEAQSGE